MVITPAYYKFSRTPSKVDKPGNVCQNLNNVGEIQLQ